MKRLAALTPRELGEAIKAERIALGRTQQAVADVTGYRRQTIVELESGKYVSTRTLFSVLSALGKGLRLVSARPDLDDLSSLLDEPDEG